MVVMKSLVDMLVRKIQAREINPITNQPFKIEDIKSIEYKTEVQKILATPTL